jgi:hypothetical protein
VAEIDNSFCANKDCKDYGLRNRGNIRYRGKYGKNKTKDLLIPPFLAFIFPMKASDKLFIMPLRELAFGQPHGCWV